MTRVTIRPDNDRQNGWYETIGPHPEPKVLEGDTDADYVVIGAGFGGLAAARRLAELNTGASIVLLEGDRIGNNAAGRCSGFIIDHAHNIRAKNFADDRSNAKRRIALNRAGLDWLDEIVHREGIDCDWRRTGKIHAAASDKGVALLDRFAASLEAVDEDYSMHDADELEAMFGTGFYKRGLHAPHSVVVQPAQLTIGLAQTMPENVAVYETSMVTDFDFGPPSTVRTARGSVRSPSLVIAANGFGEGFGLYKNRLLPLITWGSMTRPMGNDEVAALGGDDNYAIIPAHPAGTTVRRRADRRILIRNQYTYSRRSDVKKGLAAVRRIHERSLRRRYPMLPNLEFEYSWGGALSLSRNGAGVCGQVAPGVYSTMVYQGVGMAQGTISGKYLAEHMMGETNPAMSLLAGSVAPSRNFPDPFNAWGVRLSVCGRRWQAGIEE